MKTMQAVVKTEPAPGIVVTQVPVPVIEKDTDVIIQVKAVGICGSDVHIYEWTGGYEWMKDYMPLIIGHEFSGVVHEVGSAVDNVKVGDRVIAKPSQRCGNCFYCRTNRRVMCVNAAPSSTGLRRNGAFAEFVNMPSSSCIPMPENMTFAEGALIEPLGVGASGAAKAEITMGDTVVVIGPGAIGLGALLAAKAMGATTAIMIGTSRDKDRFRVAKAFGADHIIEADTTDPVKAVLDLTGGWGAKAVLEASGVPATVQQGLDMVQKGSTVVTLGIYPQPVAIDLTGLVRTTKKVVGSYAAEMFWEPVINFVGTKKVDVTQMISEQVPLERAKEAFDKMVSKESIKSVFIL